MAKVGDTPGGRLEPPGDLGLAAEEGRDEFAVILQDQHPIMAVAAGDVEDGDVREETPRDPGLEKPTAVFGSIAGNHVTLGSSGSQPTRPSIPRVSHRRSGRLGRLIMKTRSNRSSSLMVTSEHPRHPSGGPDALREDQLGTARRSLFDGGGVGSSRSRYKGSCKGWPPTVHFDMALIS